MKCSLIATLCSLFASPLMFAADIPQSLTVETPDGWNVKYRGDNGIQHYAVTRNAGSSDLLMFSPWPVKDNNRKQIPDLVKQLADGFVDMVDKSNGLITLKARKYKVEKIEGDPFSGSYVLFAIQGGVMQAMFMVGDEEGIWNGQFTGTSKGWAEALAILKGLKKR